MELKIGDMVTRMIAGTHPMELRVTEIMPDRIICGDYEFDKATGAEIDEFLGWGPPPKFHMTGSYLKLPEVKKVGYSDGSTHEIERSL